MTWIQTKAFVGFNLINEMQNCTLPMYDQVIDALMLTEGGAVSVPTKS